jgi:biopolymer transport protein ExbD
MTAVWTQITRLQVSQAGGPSSDTPPDDKALQLTLTITERGYSLSSSGATQDVPKVSGAYDVKGLEDKLKQIRTNFPDQRIITVQSEDSVKYVDLVKVIDTCIGVGLDSVSVSAVG